MLSNAWRYRSTVTLKDTDGAGVTLLAAFAAQRKPCVEFPHEKKAALLTRVERSFLGMLENSIDPSHRVFGRVRIADVVCVGRVPNRSLRQSAFNRIRAKHFDFVICKSSDLSIVCVGELDDATHAKAERRARGQVHRRGVFGKFVAVAARRGEGQLLDRTTAFAI
jgi:Protein of unknown function (DUF2726)